MNKKHLVSLLFAGSLLSLTACTTTDFISSTSSTLATVTPDISLNKFVNVRIATLKKEAAAGEGENLEALAQLMGKQDKKAFSSWLQVNYDELFTELQQPSELISRIQSAQDNASI